MIKKDYSNLKQFVINLDNYKENYDKQLPYLTEIGLNPIRFSAINAIDNEHLKSEYIKYIPQYTMYFTPKSIIGCALSHIILCNNIYNNYVNNNDSNDNEYFLILEDDCFPLYDKEIFYEKLNIALNEIQILDNKWEIIQLHSDGILPSFSSYNTHYLCGSTAAYMISKLGLKKMITKRVSNHIDFITQNFIQFNKYRVKENLFYTNETSSLNRNKIGKLTSTSISIKNNLLNIINNKLKILELRGEKNYSNYLQFKLLKIPYFNYDINLNQFIDILLSTLILKKLIKYIKKK